MKNEIITSITLGTLFLLNACAHKGATETAKNETQNEKVVLLSAAEKEARVPMAVYTEVNIKDYIRQTEAKLRNLEKKNAHLRQVAAKTNKSYNGSHQAFHSYVNEEAANLADARAKLSAISASKSEDFSTQKAILDNQLSQCESSLNNALASVDPKYYKTHKFMGE